MLGGGALALDCRLHRLADAGELDQGAVAHELNGAPAMAGEDRFKRLLAQCLEPRDRPGLVLLDEMRVAHHIGRQDRGEAPLDAHWRGFRLGHGWRSPCAD
jgi:hypothetical protein